MPHVTHTLKHLGWQFEFTSQKPAKTQTYYAEYETPFGFAVCVATDEALVSLLITDHRMTGKIVKDVAKQYGCIPIKKPTVTDPYLKKVLKPNKQLRRVQMVGTPFQLKVWETLLSIPEGETRSYLDIAKHINKPKAMRAVGGAVGQNPVCYLIPCHRVIRSDGGIGGYGGGLGVKRKMLAHEGLPQFLK
jgi:AraC family transcriptional regulator of adaptative response/methylated-DNA-[protein]-cysteine methyltransferase